MNIRLICCVAIWRDKWKKAEINNNKNSVPFGLVLLFWETSFVLQLPQQISVKCGVTSFIVMFSWLFCNFHSRVCILCLSLRCFSSASHADVFISVLHFALRHFYSALFTAVFPFCISHCKLPFGTRRCDASVRISHCDVSALHVLPLWCFPVECFRSVPFLRCFLLYRWLQRFCPESCIATFLFCILLISMSLRGVFHSVRQ